MPEMNGFELYDQLKKLDNKVKVCFISSFDVDYTALGEQFPSLERSSLIPKNIIRKPIEVSKLIEKNRAGIINK
jgi:two-component SAPR family response regulator